MLSRFLIICTVLLTGACGTQYVIESDPPGAQVFRGSSYNDLKYFATTPYIDSSATPRKWTGTFIQLRKEGYLPTEVTRLNLGVAEVHDVNLRYSLETDILVELVEIEKSDDLEAYYSFLDKYPGNQYTARMFDRMFELVKASADIKAHDRLLQHFNAKSNRIYQSIYRLYSAQKHTLSEYFDFISRYPGILSELPALFKRLISMIDRSHNPLKQYYGLLAQHAFVANDQPEVFKTMVGLMLAGAGDSDGQLRKLLSQYPASMRYMPARIRLADIGPEGMKVYQAIDYIKKGMSPAILRQKILNSGVAYKEFSFEEITELNKIGLPQDVIAAMLEVTSRIEREAGERRRQEQQNLARQRERQVEREQHAQRQQQSQQQAQAEEKSVPAECLKLVAAIKVCDQAGGFLAMGCKAIANSKFDCPIPVAELM
ncbi:MAG: hypothetical protein OEY11_09505 [Gammaproteobacteria bacterium]|nr:hypothetical protein [Gammaproteobacteria bacterium]